MNDCLKPCSHAGLLPELCHGVILLQHDNSSGCSMGSEHPGDAGKSTAADSPACLWSPQGCYSNQDGNAESGGQPPGLQIHTCLEKTYQARHQQLYRGIHNMNYGLNSALTCISIKPFSLAELKLVLQHMDSLFVI